MRPFAFIFRIESPTVRKNVRWVLHELAVLSEAPALVMEASISQGKAEDSIPKGVRMDRRPVPDKDDSLYEHYLARFAKAETDHDFERIYEQANVDLEFYRKGLPVERIALRAEADEDRDTRHLLEHGEGIHFGVIAARMSWPPSWVKVQRERNGRDPTYGWSRPDFRSMSAAERKRTVKQLKAEGNTQREVAVRLGVSVRLVAEYWPAGKARAA